MESNKDVIIIGGGVIGLACAHYLIDNGASVRIIEKDEIGHGASHGNCGLLYFSDVIPLCSPGTVSHEMVRTLKRTSPLYIKPTLDYKRWIWLLKFALKCNAANMKQTAMEKYEILNYSIRLFETLLAMDTMDCDFEKKGILSVFKEKQNFEKYQATNDFLATYHMEARRIDQKELQQIEPALRNDIAGAWLNENDWHLRPDMLMSSWRKHLCKKGLVIEEHCKVLEFNTIGNSVTGVNTVKGHFTADTFVLATGAWAPQTLQQLKLDLPVQPGKGYSITMERPGLCPTYPCSLYEKSMVATPWKSGYRLGGTMEFSGYNDHLNPERLAKLISGATAFLKEPLGHPVIEQWTSLRPMTYDDMPIIDFAPALGNLVIATGHGMLGITLATGTGKIVCDLVYGKTPEINVTPFGLSRFH